MSNFVFFAVPLFGHVNYGTKIAKYLQKNGHCCYYFSGERYKDLVESKGLCYCEYSDQIETMFREESSTYNTAVMSTRKGENIDYIEEIWKLSHHLFSIMRIVSQEDIKFIRHLKPDGIIYDNIAIWGRWVADQLGVPCFSSGTPYCYNDQMFHNYPEEFHSFFTINQSSDIQPILPILRMYNRMLHQQFPEFLNYSATTNYAGSGDINFIYTVPSFQLHPELIDAQTNYFTGILIDEDDFIEDVDTYISKTHKNVYIALGTIYNNQMLYQKCIDTLRDFNANIILSIGMTNTVGSFNNIPQQWKVQNSFPQINLLQYIDVFISHGGANSLREAAYFGVPTVVIPQTGDHFLVAKDVKRAGIGYVLDKNFTKNEIVQSVINCINTADIKNSCNLLSQEMQQAGGLDKVVKIIESVVT